jgi:hypothetical protein
LFNDKIANKGDTMLKDLVKMASKLDALGLNKEADVIDNLVRKIASREDELQSYMGDSEYGMNMGTADMEGDLSDVNPEDLSGEDSLNFDEEDEDTSGETPEDVLVARMRAAEILKKLQEMSKYQFFKLYEAHPEAFHQLFDQGTLNEVPLYWKRNHI